MVLRGQVPFRSGLGKLLSSLSCRMKVNSLQIVIFEASLDTYEKENVCVPGTRNEVLLCYGSLLRI